MLQVSLSPSPKDLEKKKTVSSVPGLLSPKKKLLLLSKRFRKKILLVVGV
jgi:hypothetical protein